MGISRGLGSVALLLLLAGCGGGSPTASAGTAFVSIAGVLTSDASISTPLPAGLSDRVTLELVELTPQLVDVTLGEYAISLGVGIGVPNDEDDGCTVTAARSFVEGDSWVIQLTATTGHCVSLYDNGTMPQDAVVAVELTVTAS
jgi:hypothetical protein